MSKLKMIENILKKKATSFIEMLGKQAKNSKRELP